MTAQGAQHSRCDDLCDSRWNRNPEEQCRHGLISPLLTGRASQGAQEPPPLPHTIDWDPTTCWDAGWRAGYAAALSQPSGAQEPGRFCGTPDACRTDGCAAEGRCNQPVPPPLRVVTGAQEPALAQMIDRGKREICGCVVTGGGPTCRQRGYGQESWCSACRQHALVEALQLVYAQALVTQRGAQEPAILRELVKKLEAYIEWNGPEHEDDCPGDDTCDCEYKPMNDGINEVHRFLVALSSLPSSAPNDQTDA